MQYGKCGEKKNVKCESQFSELTNQLPRGIIY